MKVFLVGPCSSSFQGCRKAPEGSIHRALRLRVWVCLSISKTNGKGALQEPCTVRTATMSEDASEMNNAHNMVMIFMVGEKPTASMIPLASMVSLCGFREWSTPFSLSVRNCNPYIFRGFLMQLELFEIFLPTCEFSDRVPSHEIAVNRLLYHQLP